MTNSVYTPETKKVRRSRTDKMLTGVCGGWSQYLGIDANVLRIGLVAAVFLSVGIAIPIYIAAAILTPEEDS
ncbi:PspC domain-containing protein [Amycolatopsis sp., V23-08]|jgi:phage shock protein PspC (stress-responsive transcriptional regulator)|uniref:PspC domain-containing protein n=1 Tax=Amycolatopsis heterodermiae TaxID=3110235 RepID=A0ABU5R023_9PSEU|nr:MULTISPECIES: PspC domain-containing protein [Amycolatopsis]MEA5359029.1 PspC domain-containing protein [Amycolatopsis sp., V23-08]WSK81924.1 PspC domain-containing protein [Amycolatopsis sp. NBC_01286]